MGFKFIYTKCDDGFRDFEEGTEVTCDNCGSDDYDFAVVENEGIFCFDCLKKLYNISIKNYKDIDESDNA